MCLELVKNSLVSIFAGPPDRASITYYDRGDVARLGRGISSLEKLTARSGDLAATRFDLLRFSDLLFRVLYEVSYVIKGFLGVHYLTHNFRSTFSPW